MPEEDETVSAKVRYQMKPALCSWTYDGNRVEMVFETPQKPTAPGQVAAFYTGDELLGGGIVADV